MNAASFKPSYDAIIIGGGVAGLTSAALLAKAGLSVCLLEKEPHPGGYLAGFRRKDFRFDTAIHWLNQYGPEGMVTHLFKLLGNDYPEARTQLNIRRYVGEGFSYLLTSNPEELKAEWQKEFPQDADGIARFFKAAKALAKAFSSDGYIFRSGETMNFMESLNSKKKLLKFVLPFIPHVRYSGEGGLKKGLNKYFKSEKLQRVFAADTELLSCLIPISWAYINDYQSPPLGGGQRIPEWLAHIAAEHHADVVYQCDVKEVLLDGKTATGVRLLRRGTEYSLRSKYVIAACDVEMLYERLLPKGTIPQKLIDKLHNAELYSSSVTVSIALDCPSGDLGFSEELIHIAGAAHLAHEGVTNDAGTSEISILAPSYRDPSLAPEGMGTLTLYMPAEMDFRDFWETGEDAVRYSKKNEAYKTLKQQLAETLIDRVVAKVAPNLREHILFYDVATPITHWRYTGNRGGTMMGAKPGRANMQNKIAHYRTPVKNLLLGGHWAELGGGVPIAVKAGANAALLVLKETKQETAKALAAYMDKKASLPIVLQKGSWLPAPNNWIPTPTPAEKKKLRESVSSVQNDSDEEEQ